MPEPKASTKASARADTKALPRDSVYVKDDSVATLPLLSEDVLAEILSMLHPREMLSFASTSKSMMSMLTHANVIRGGVVISKLNIKKKSKTKAPKSEAEMIMDLVRSRTIFIPSPMRFLRLLIGKRCERPGCTNECSLQASIAIYICTDCMHDTGFLRPIYVSKAPPCQNMWKYINDDRVAKEKRNHGHWLFPVSQPYYSISGERCGPLVTMSDIENMAWKAQKLDDFVESLKPHEGFPTESTTKKLLNVYDQALKGYSCIDEERKMKAQMRKKMREVKEREAQARRNAKKDIVLNVVQQISDLTDDRWRDVALSYDWDSPWKGQPKFLVPIVHDRITVYTRAPSKATPNKLADVAKNINHDFRLLYDSGFHDLSFLPNDLSEEPFQAIVRDCFSEEYPTSVSWLAHATDDVLHKVREGNNFEALLAAWNYTCRVVDADKWRETHILNVFLARYVLSRKGDHSTNDLVPLATSVWQHIVTTQTPKTLTEYEAYFQEMEDLWSKVFSLVCGLLLDDLNSNLPLWRRGQRRRQLLLPDIHMLGLLCSLDEEGVRQRLNSF